MSPYHTDTNELVNDVYGDRPSDDVLDYLRQIVGFDHARAHERKNEASSRPVRDALSERMRLAETAAEWLEQL